MSKFDCTNCKSTPPGDRFIYGIPGKYACTLDCIPNEYLTLSILKIDKDGARANFTLTESAYLQLLRTIM